VSFFDVPLTGKRLEILRELLPNVRRIALLLDPKFRAAEAERQGLVKAGREIGREVVIINPDSEGEFAGAFAKISQSGAGALLVGSGPLFNRERRQVVAPAARHAIPAIYPLREPVEVGGLLSYGASQTDAYRRAGIYATRVLKGEKPADLPIELPTKFDLVINLKTAKALGLDVPPTLLARADEVIE
jgi:putative tryptophan/tyrosine transport system substrate-binding protein